MFEISKAQGLQVFENYRRSGARLHVRGSIHGQLAWSPATITEASTEEDKVYFKFFDTPEGPTWMCPVSLTDAKFWFDPTGAAEWKGSGAYEWQSSMRISYIDGTELVLGEQITTIH